MSGHGSKMRFPTNFWYVLIILIAIRTTVQQEEEPSSEIVETSLGRIQGTIIKSQYGVDFNAFRGIPYAQSPTGDLRFRAPQPTLPWTGIFKATRDLPGCPQSKAQALITEDCLKLNVFTRNLTGHVPVIVYIHGGGNVLGSGSSLYEAGPQYLLDHDVVFVAFNYRLGALGFLSTRTAEAPGNFGFLDQVLALKWVKEHISNFGGDPNMVTIFGMSAGSMAVTLHMASPLSRGLFHRAIAMSGSATNHYNIDNLYWTRKLARDAGCPMYNPKDLVDCLRNVTWNKIISTCSRWGTYGFVNMSWNYEIDRNFLVEHPTESFYKGDISKVPLLAGITKNEFDFSFYHQKDNKGLLNDISVNFDFYAPEMFNYNASVSEPSTSQRIREFYLGSETSITKDNLNQIGEIFSDASIGHGVHRLVNFARKFTDVYYYRVDYVGQNSHYIDDDGQPRGVGHADDLSYVLPGLWNGGQMELENPDMFMVNRMTNLWTTFARYGVPSAAGVVNWLPSNISHLITLYNDKETFLADSPYQDRYKLWDELFPHGKSGSTQFRASMFLLFVAGLIKFIL